MAREAASSSSPASLPAPLDAAQWATACKALHLSPQQVRIVELVLCGLRDKEIAQRLQLTVPTVRTYLGRVFQRVGARDRVELILKVLAASRAPVRDAGRHSS